MTKIIWMSDPHFQNNGTIRGLDPRKRLALAIDHINTHHSDADFAVLSGDLIGDDVAENYSGIAGYLAKSNIPVHPMMGNNDRRAGLRSHLPLPANCMDDFVQYEIETTAARIVCLDTHKIGSDAGEFCETRRIWLRDALDRNADHPTYIFMHHPPMPLGLPMQDAIMLDDGDAFLDLVKQYEHVKYLFMGHVHRPTSGVINGIPFSSIGALSFQAPPPRPAWEWDGFVAAREAPHYGVVSITGGHMTLQYTQFCAYEDGIDAAS